MKKLRSFSSLYVNDNQNMSHFQQCSSMFIMPRKIISNIYLDFPDDETLKIYMYLSMHCASTDIDGQVPGDVFIGKQRIEKELNMSTVTVNKSMDWLESRHFILKTRQKKGRTVLRRVLVAPDYLPGSSGSFYSCSNIERTTEGLKANNHGYIMLPSNLFTTQMLSASKAKQLRFMGKAPVWEQSHWDQRKLKILMMLYSHFWLRYFGGIDPNVVKVERDTITGEGYIDVHESFCYEIKADQKSVERTIASFVERGLIKPVSVLFRDRGDGEYVFAEDIRSPYSPNKDERQICILRPTFIFEKQVTDYKLGGVLIP
ncbi:hypothetical protein [Paenibacillus sp. PAMC21692]|uniref:hypothetical protein n=1 Tax=Paenibacillus sp. PAMC21692 TaxID=2762320 RepID=UPI00164D13C3|nr:hypothetical protein [Paenibacillus sp. PAMC21692]QNK57442.1 hypothetical protein H7F31_00100 [Paenibacillus sp. PAMC21692]